MLRTNPLRSRQDDELQLQDFKNNLASIPNIKNLEVIQKALVISEDRHGGRFEINKGNAGENNIVSCPFVLKVRLLNNRWNANENNKEDFLDIDEYYVRYFGSPNIIDVPEPGEIVLIIFDKPLSESTNISGYWIGRTLDFATKEYQTTFKRREASQQKHITNSQSNIYGGIKPSVLETDYQIRPNANYEPFPLDLGIFKSGDIGIVGKSNTMMRHSFSIFKEKDDSDIQSDLEKQDDGKKGYVEIGTEYLYLENTTDINNFSYYDENLQDVSPEEYETIRLNHLKKNNLPDRNRAKWEFLNSGGSRIILGTKLNIDARLIHNDTEKDWSGENGNIKKFYHEQFRDEGKGRYCGNEILQQHFTLETTWNNTQSDIIKTIANERGAISFDENIPHYFSESEIHSFISRIGEEINHGVLGERLSLWLTELLIIILHQNRSIDILNSRLHLLSEDFLKHIHPVKPGLTNPPLGSTNSSGGVIIDYIWYDDTTSDDVGGDSSFDESGSDSPSMKIKDRTKEEREKMENLIKTLPSVMSKTFRLN